MKARSLSLVAFALLASASTAAAQTPDPFNSQRFRSAMTPRDGLTLTLPQTLGKRSWSLHGTFGYEKEPLISGSPTGDVSIIDQRLSLALDVAVAVIDRLDVFVALSSTATQSSDDLSDAGLNEPSSAGLEDPRLGLRALLRDGDIWDLGVMGGLSIPIGSDDALLSDDGIGVEGRLLNSIDLEAIILALDLGARYRPVAHYRELEQGSELALRAGVHVPLLARKLRLMVELDSATRVSSEVFSSLGTPVEALFGGRYAFDSGLTAGAAGGVAINGAAGTPTGRALVQIGFVGHGKQRPRDDDADGVLADDQCPAQAEDRDGFADADGCPDEDNDGDRIADASDRCIDRAEDGLGSQPSDGCPNAEPIAPLDQDKDGIADASDRCIEQPEDLDGYQDDDGCPDPDDDGDGVADASDGCPRERGSAPTGCPPPAPVAPVEVQVAAASPVPPAAILFERNSTTLAPSSQAALAQLRDELRAHPERTLRVIGYTSEGGSEQHNRQLSLRRAEAVRAALVSLGAPKARISAEGRGTREPKADNTTEEGRTQNQRVEFSWDE